MIIGDRMRLRAAEREDLPRFVAWFNDPEVTRYLARHYPMSLAAEERWFDKMVGLPPAEQVLVIEIRDGEVASNSPWKAIGTIAFKHVDTINRSAEIGIVIGEKAYWNQGYGRDGMRLMLKYGFCTLNLHRIFLRVYESNVRGIKAYEHAGFKHEGRMRQAFFQDGRYYDVLLMSVLSEEFFGQPAG